MNDRNLDQLLNAWMDLGPTTAPDRVADAARLEVVTTRQLPAVLSRWAPRRFPVMNTTAKVILATAAVVLAVALGYNYLVAPNVGGPRLFAPDPTPTPSPRRAPAADRLHATSRVRERRCSRGPISSTTARRWRSPSPCPMNRSRPIRPPGTRRCMTGARGTRPTAARLGFGDVENVRVDACDPGPGWQDPPVGPGVAELVEALSAIPIIDVTRSSATVDGYSGELLDMTGAELPAGCSDAPILWETTRGDEILVPATAERLRVWVLDVEGNRLVVWASDRPINDQARQTICRP